MPENAGFPLAADFAPAVIYVARRRWHIDVGFAADSLRPPLVRLLRGFPAARYAFFGFGDRRYLMAKHRDAPVLLEALWPGAGLILLTTLANSPQQAFGAAQVIELRLTAPQSRAAQLFIWRSLTQTDAAAVAAYAPGPYQGSAYYAAAPRYSALHTCITWAAEVLRAAGLPVRTRLTVLAGQLWRQALKLPAAMGYPARPLADDAAAARRSPVSASIAGGRIAVLANHGRTAALRHDDGGLGRGRGTAAADAASQ